MSQLGPDCGNCFGKTHLPFGLFTHALRLLCNKEHSRMVTKPSLESFECEMATEAFTLMRFNMYLQLMQPETLHKTLQNGSELENCF